MSYPGKAPTHLADLISTTHSKILSSMREKIETLDTEKIQQAIPIAIKKEQRLVILLLNQELTKRNIPPFLRKLDGLIDMFEGDADSQMIDLDWIAHQYVNNQKTAYGFYSQLFNPYRFIKTAEMIWQRGQRPMWKIVSGLKLTAKQQWQCHYICDAKVRKQRKQLSIQLPDVIAELRSAHFRRGLTLITSNEIEMFQRRLEVWEIAHIATWSPTVTAKLYTLKTGKELSRQMASKILFKLKRDAWKFTS